MAEYIIQSETLTSIADAIREKTGLSNSMSPASFANAIGLIETGGSCGRVSVKTGTTTSSTIDTGLSSIDYFIIYESSVTSTGFVQGTYRADTGNTIYTYCSSYTTWTKAYAIEENTNGSVSGGTFTWGGTGTQALSNNTYNWVAVGIE